MSKPMSMEIVVNEDKTRSLLSGNIRCLRKQLKLSQEELGHKVGLNRGNIASYEKGTAEPKICNLLRLAHLFKVSILDLTRRDLSQAESALTNAAGSPGPSIQSSFLDEYREKSDELRIVVNSIYTCQQYKARTLEGSDDRNVQTILANFEQLHDATQALMRHHAELLERLDASK